MKTKAKIALLVTVVATMLFACSTEKNTWINRNYHGLTAHYNGYYNANDLIDKGIMSYRDGRIESYYDLLPIDPVPDEKEVAGMYPAIDTAIVKCKKVILNHSMPSNDRPALKKDEHNKWIDENWTTIGIASYYRRDYEGAMKSFKYVRKFYTNDPSLYVGELWMAKTNIATGKYTEAKFNLDNLDKAIVREAEMKKEKPAKKSKIPGKKKASKEDEIAKVPKSIRFDLEKTKAQLALIKDDKDNAIVFLEESLKHARFHDDKARVHFILGQLYAEKGENASAEEHFTRVVKGRAKFELAFNARLKRAFLGSGPKVQKDLTKMLKDPKNAEYKDQIYYALAEIAFKDGNDELAIERLHNSAFYSTNNSRQKGMAYERLADYKFAKREYVSAQKYYDSCAQVIKETYPNAEGIRGKAQNLAKLVVAVETASREDSLQRIAAMDEGDRENFIKAEIKRIKEEEAERKRKEEERLRELQANQNTLVNDNGNGAKWYWNNDKAKREGFDEFKRLWGQREDEDDWRRSQKIPNANFDPNNPEAQDSTNAVVVVEDTLTVEMMLANVPLTDSMMALSNARLMKAYFDAGRIYNEQLNEPVFAKGMFESAVAKNLMTDPHDLLSAFQLYKLTQEKDAAQAEVHKQYILTHYPNSDFANYLRDPEYFRKKKERDALAVQEYVTVLERYERRLFYPVITKADQVIDGEKDNIYRAKYMLLKAMCQGELEKDKTKLLPVLEMLVAEYPESEEAVRGREMINIIKNGYSENISADFSSKSVYKFREKTKMRVIIILPERVTTTTAINRVSNFNKEFFGLDPLEIDTKLLGLNQSVITVKEFDNEIKASTYITAFQNTKKHLLDLTEAKIYIISKENMATLFQRTDLVEFEKFYKEYY